MLILILSITPLEAFNRASTLLNENNLDSVVYYLNIAYQEFPNEVENLIYLKYLEDKKIGFNLAFEFTKINKKSKRISTIALFGIIEEKKYNEINNFLEIYPETTMLGRIISFYNSIQNKKYDEAIRIGEDLLNAFRDVLRIMSEFPLLDTTEMTYNLLRKFRDDYVDFTCQKFYLEYCLKYIPTLESKEKRQEMYNYVILYGFWGLVSDAKNFEESYNNLIKFIKFLKDNNCKDYEKLLIIFTSIQYSFESESYEEYKKFLSAVDTLENYCGNKLNVKVKLLRAYGLRGLDMNKKAIEILLSLKDSLNEPQRRFLIASTIDYLDFELAKNLISEFNINDSLILRIIDPFKNCDLLYNQRKLKDILKICNEETPERAYAYFLLSKKDSAIEIIKNLIENLEISSKNYTYYWNKGWFKLLIGEIDSSYYLTSKALEMKPNNSFLIMNLGSIYLAKFQIDSALYYYKKAYNVNKEYGNYKESSFFQVLRNDVELISKIYNLKVNSKEILEKVRK